MGRIQLGGVEGRHGCVMGRCQMGGAEGAGTDEVGVGLLNVRIDMRSPRRGFTRPCAFETQSLCTQRERRVQATGQVLARLLCSPSSRFYKSSAGIRARTDAT